MKDRRIFSRFMLGGSILCIGVFVGGLLLLEKNGNHPILGTGTSITTAVVVGTLLMIPGAASVLQGFHALTGKPSQRRSPSEFIGSGFWALSTVSAAAVLFVVYQSFGMTLNVLDGVDIPVPKSILAWNIDRPLYDAFHEGEIIGSIGFFASDSPRDIPMVIHGAGRNLLPAWIVTNFGGDDTMIAKMRFVTSAGNFLSMLLAAACAFAATLTVVSRQKTAALGHAEILAFSALGVLFAMALVAKIGSVSNRNIVLFAVLLVSILLIWSAMDRHRFLTSALAGLLGALTVLSPLHTYLGGIQSVMVALAAAAITLLVSPGRRLALLVMGVLGALTAFVVVCGLGGYWLFQDAVAAILYWSENAEAIWSYYAPRFVLLGSLALMMAGALLGGFSLAGMSIGMQDRAARGVLTLLVVVIVASTYSYANLSDINHFGFALFVCSPAIAVAASLVFLTIGKVSATASFVLASFLALPVSIALFQMEGNSVFQAVKRLETPDREILPENVVKFATRFQKELEGQDCLLIMSNDGALAYLPRLPLCGPMFNPIHLNSEGDRLLANWLENNPQNLVVDGAPGHGSVGGPPMRNRFPHTYEVIDRLYPNLVRLDKWEIRLP